MTDLYTLAAKHPKVKKEHAQNMIIAISESHPELKESLAQLYSFFMPSVPKKLKEINHEWVYKAISKQPGRYYLHHAYSDGENLVATNGEVLHYIPTNLPIGYYNQKGIKIEHDYTFPDWKRILSDLTEISPIEIDLEKAPIHKEEYDNKYYYECNGIYFAKEAIDNFANGDKILKGTICELINNLKKCVLKIEGEKSGLIVSKG